jgi:hypothetical protein
VETILHPSRYIHVLRSNRDFADGSDDTDLDITYPAVVGVRHVCWNIFWSYDGDPTGGYIRGLCAGQPVTCVLPITAGGIGWLRLKVVGMMNQPLTVRLGAGGGGVIGHLHIEQHWTRNR